MCAVAFSAVRSHGHEVLIQFLSHPPHVFKHTLSPPYRAFVLISREQIVHLGVNKQGTASPEEH